MIFSKKLRCAWFYLFVFLFILPPAKLKAQINWYFPLTGRVQVMDEKKNKPVDLDASVVTLYKGSAVVTSTTTGSNGKFSFKLDPNNDYVVSFSKPGFINKKIAISTRNVPDERASHGFSGYDLSVTIFEQYSGIDYSVLNNPVGKLVYNPSKDVEDFDYDKAYTDQMQNALAKLEELARQARENEKKYQAAIAKADKAFNAKDYAGAKAGYQEAASVKANEPYPKEKTKECDVLIAQAQQAGKADADYKAAIAAGDAAFTAKNYDVAKTSYTTASGMKPAEQYPKDKLKALDDLNAKAVADKALNDKYAAAIKRGDDAMAAKDYTNAKSGYTDATGMKPTEAYPKQKLKDLEDLLAKAAAAKDIDAKYQAAIKKGDDAMTAKDYTTAKAGYTDATGLKPAEQYPKDKLKAIADLLTADLANKALNDKYNAAIKKGDDALATKDYTTAKAGYTDASSLKPAEQYPKDKLKIINDQLAKDLADKALNDKYNAAIKKGDDALTAKDYSTAKAGYTDASGLKPTEQYPKDKLKAIADILGKDAKDKELKAKFDAAIAKGDKAMGGKDYNGAKNAFNEAISIKSDEQYPKDRVKEIDALMAKDAVEKEKNARYQAALAKADAAFKIKKYDDAKGGYSEATGIKPDEAYPKAQLKAIEDILNADLANKALNDKYSAAIAKADAAFKSKDYETAKGGYNEALGLKVTEAYPKSQLKAIADLLNADLASKTLNDKYNAAVKKGDDAFTVKDYSTAKTGFTDASGLKPAEQYPKDKLKAIADILGKDAKDKELKAKYDAAVAKGDKGMTAKDFNAAKLAFNEALTYKAEEQYPKDKLKEISGLLDKDAASKALTAKYNAAVAKADLAFKAKKYDDAKGSYNEAIGLKADEAYPKAQLKAIEDMLNTDQANKALNDKYNAAIAKADVAFKAKDYSNAKTSYNEALGLKSAEAYPKAQLKAIDDLLSKDASAKEKYAAAIKKGDDAFAAKEYNGAKTSYAEASGLKPGEQYPKDKLKEIADILNKASQGKELDAKYAAAVAKGDQNLKTKAYAIAQTAFTEASGLKPSEQYPKDKLKEIEGLLKNADAQKEKNVRYSAAITKADLAFKTKKYDEAKTSYLEAQGIKPEEEYPPARLKEIEEQIAREGSLKDLNSRYNAAIYRGDQTFQEKDYTKAKAAYEEALGVKPGEAYPKTKLDQIALQLAKDEKDKSLAEKYNKAVQDGDKAMGTQDYPSAKTAFSEANGLKPNEMYPKDKLSEIARAMSDKAKREEREAKYKEAVAKGDASFSSKEYATARTFYGAGLAAKPGDTYCTGKLAEIDNLVQSLESQKQRDKKYNEAIGRADKAFNSKDYPNAKSAYAEALAVKPSESYPKGRILQCDAQMNIVKGPVVAEVHKDVAALRSELAKKYGEGVTELAEVEDGNCKVLTKIVVHGGDAWKYTRRTYSWATYYFRDDVSIGQAVWDAETAK
jgi:tetratricopeptide (TPR) repeat protein